MEKCKIMFKKISEYLCTKGLSLCIVIVCMMACAPILGYVIFFRKGEISCEPEVWGAFGDFLGGTLSIPIFFSSIIIVFLARRLQKKDTYMEKQKDAAMKLYKQCKLLESKSGSVESTSIISDFIVLLDEFDIYFEDSFVKKMRNLTDKRIVYDKNNISHYVDSDIAAVEKELKRIIHE